MKIPVTLSFFFFFTFSLKTLWAQKLPEKQKVLKDMLLAYEYFMIMLLIRSNFSTWSLHNGNITRNAGDQGCG